MNEQSLKTLGEKEETDIQFPFTMNFASVPQAHEEDYEALKYNPKLQMNDNAFIAGKSTCTKRSKTTDYWKTSPFQRDTDDDTQQDD